MAGGPDFLALWPRPASFLRAGELMFTPLGVITPSTRLLPQVAITRAVRRVGVKPAHKIKTPFYELQTLCKVTGGHRSTDRCSKACRETAFSRFGCPRKHYFTPQKTLQCMYHVRAGGRGRRRPRFLAVPAARSGPHFLMSRLLNGRTTL